MPFLPATAAIGLGSNVGDAAGHVERAIVELAAIGVVRERSSLYRTAPWGVTDQDEFVNAAALLDTRLEPRGLLHALKAIEAKIGRVTTYRWGPRVIDCDILTYGELELREPDLVVPHERLFERAFALGPLAEIDPRFRDAFEALPQAAREELERLPFALRDLRADDPDDARAAARLLARVVDEGLYLATEAPVDVEALAQRMLRRSGARTTILAVERARVVGEINLFGIDGREADGIRRAAIGMCVAPDRRGRGIGGALMAAAVRRARELELGELSLEVFPHNAAAIALYERFGFRHAATRRRAYPRKSGDVWDAHVMKLPLA